VSATRYVTPLHEGGSLPAIVEADDDGMYVLKFRGAGQGAKALIAELVAGEIARALRLPIPEIVLIELDPDLARTEPDPEIQDLIKASAGMNVALDYLPGAVMFDALAEQPPAGLASDIVWFDAFVTNVDRTPRNANMLMWHRQLKLIDHGAALYFHHSWNQYLERAADPFTRVKDHILLPFAAALEESDARSSALLARPEVLENIVALIPESWLGVDPLHGLRPEFATPQEYRQAYLDYLQLRLKQRHAFVQEALRARQSY
jgi:hypothetical protein